MDACPVPQTRPTFLDILLGGLVASRRLLAGALLVAAAAEAGGAKAPAIHGANPLPPSITSGSEVTCFLARVRKDIEAVREVLPGGAMDRLDCIIPSCRDKGCAKDCALWRYASRQDLGFGHVLFSEKSWLAHKTDWNYSILTRNDSILWADIRWHSYADSTYHDSVCGTVPPAGRIEFRRDSDATIWIGKPELADDTLLRRLADIQGSDQVVFHGEATTQFDRSLHRLGARQLVTLTHAMNVGTRIEALRYLLHHHTDRALINPLLKSVGPAWTRKEPPRSVLALLSRKDLHWIARAMATTKTVKVLEEDVEGDVDALDYLLTPDETESSWQRQIMDGPDVEP